MDKDWVGEVFAATRDCGESIAIVFGHRREASQPPQWFERPHDQYDGIGAFAQLLREQGCRVDRLPQLQGDRRSVWRTLRGLAAVLPTMQLRPRRWRRFDAAQPVRHLPPEARVAWRVLDAATTQRLIAGAKQAGVTVNTLLLHALDGAVAAQLTEPGSTRRWMIPVNLRGAVTRQAEQIPHMSFLAADLDDAATPASLQAQIDGLRARGFHWGSWALLNAGRLTGARAMRQDMQRRERQGHGWTGIFSNLGVWDDVGSGHWIFCPAISRVHPVGAGCITANGCLALTVQLHEALALERQTADDLLQAWLDACPLAPSSESFAPATAGARHHAPASAGVSLSLVTT